MKSFDLNHPPLVLLDDSRPAHKSKPSLLFHSPEHIIRADKFEELDEAFEAIDDAVSSGLYVAGWIAYECARHFEKKLAAALTKKADEPLIWMLATKHRAILSSKDVETLFHTANHGNIRRASLDKSASPETEEAYLSSLSAIQEYITAGDVYQINYTLPIPTKLSGAAPALYNKLRQRQPVAFGAYIDTGEEKILSLSPELFIEKQGSDLLARPMKGTAPRGRTHSEDQHIQQFLKDDPKSQAENLMIVDLIRNDLSRISDAGSVKVPALFDVEQYPTLHQMTSSVTAKAQANLKPSELLAAMFPCGSVTGAPKVRAMEIIASLERTPRGVYCGTIGHFSPATATRTENWCLNVPIRTLVLNTDNKGRMSVGSGVVADSDPSSEYKECLLKANFTDGDPTEFSLIETMRYSDGKISTLSRHLERLQSSALYFDFPFNQTAIQEALAEHLLALTSPASVHRVRLLLDKNGAMSVTSEPHRAEEITELTVCLSTVHTDSSDPFLFHKTTNRSLYNRAFTAARSMGHADVLFFNEASQLTEGAISSIFIEKNGQLYTPPVEAGLLAGIHRETMLTDNNAVQTRVLYHNDLLNADKLYISNALRGLRQVSLSTDTWHP